MWDELIGFVGLATTAGVTLFLGLRYPKVRTLLNIVFVVLVALTLFDHYVSHLPAANPEYGQIGRHREFGVEWSRDGFRAALQHFTGPDDYFYAFTIALLYSITGESVLLVRSFSVLAGVLTVFSGWLLARELWGEKALAGKYWVFLLSPMALLYLSMTRREPFAALFLVVGLWLVARYHNSGRLRYAGLGILSFYVGHYYHGPILLAAVVFVIGITLHELRTLATRGISDHRRLLALGTGVFLLIGALAVPWGLVRIPKVGELGQLALAGPTVLEDQMARISDAYAGRYDSFPRWTVGTSPNVAVAVLPLRMAAFLFGPPLWQAGGPFGAVLMGGDGLIYLAYTALILWHRKVVWRHAGARTVFLILLVLIAAYAVGTATYTGAMRHRMKLVAGLVALVVPMVPRLVWRARGVHRFDQ